MTDIEEISEIISQFTKERDWEQFHNGKDLALALSIEAAELNEKFLWKSDEDVSADMIKDELQTFSITPSSWRTNMTLTSRKLYSTK